MHLGAKPVMSGPGSYQPAPGRIDIQSRLKFAMCWSQFFKDFTEAACSRPFATKL